MSSPPAWSSGVLRLRDMPLPDFDDLRHTAEYAEAHDGPSQSTSS
ncbi:hypothetical protein [Streptomyces sp. XH2]